MTSRLTQTYRYERKFVVDHLDRHQVRAVLRLHPALFVEAYPPRFVNSLYLDSEGLEYYHDHVSDANPRRKVRVRWYGDLLGKVAAATLEVKIRMGAVGSKQLHPLGSFVLAPGFSAYDVRGLLRAAGLPAEVWASVRDLRPVLITRYYRHYYATLDGRFRLTVDSELTYQRVGQLGSHLLHSQCDHRQLVVELKYGAEHASAAGHVSSLFPFRLVRNSKYVEGIERVYIL
jgi:hypothetical protein